RSASVARFVRTLATSRADADVARITSSATFPWIPNDMSGDGFDGREIAAIQKRPARPRRRDRVRAGRWPGRSASEEGPGHLAHVLLHLLVLLGGGRVDDPVLRRIVHGGAGRESDDGAGA